MLPSIQYRIKLLDESCDGFIFREHHDHPFRSILFASPFAMVAKSISFLANFLFAIFSALAALATALCSSERSKIIRNKTTISLSNAIDNLYIILYGALNIASLGMWATCNPVPGAIVGSLRSAFYPTSVRDDDTE